VQIFGDSHGNAVHLFERDCSAQRRHQKVIEEAPAPGLSDAQRTAMGEAAVAAAKAVRYTGAGTVEFVLDDSGFYFLEMNTRLQVEHPVTEMVTGYDLVEWQLRVAAGEPLPARQQDIALNGHAFEVRLYAEDPARDFAPSIGRLSLFRTPDESDGVRVDTGFATGDAVSIHYDAMLAKLICHGADRTEALAKLRGALRECEVGGLATNIDLLHRIASHPDFAAGGIDTGFIAREAATLLAGQAAPPAEVLAALALTEVSREEQTAARDAAVSADPFSPWHARDGWWINASRPRTLHFMDGDTAFPVSVVRSGKSWQAEALGRTLIGQAHADGMVVMDGVHERMPVAVDGETRTIRRAGETWRLRLADPGAAGDDDADGGGSLVAPIPGLVTAANVAPGDHVTRGEVLVILEAMKTVFRLTAKADAVVATVDCAVGEMVQDGQVLVTFDET